MTAVFDPHGFAELRRSMVQPEGQRHLQARPQEMGERFARFQHPNLRPRNARP